MIETTIRRTAATLMLCIAVVAWAGGNDEREPTAPRDGGSRIDIPDRDEAETEGRPLWLLAEHPIGEDLLREIGRVASDRYTPAGIDIDGETASVLYMANDAQVGAVALLPIERPADLEVELTSALQGDMVPAGISFGSTGLVVMLVESPDHRVRGWEIDLVDASDLDGLIASYEEYGERGFVPVGLALNGRTEAFWILYLDTQSTVGVLINGFPFSDVRRGIAEDTRAGARPSGLTRSEGAYFVQYIFLQQ